MEQRKQIFFNKILKCWNLEKCKTTLKGCFGFLFKIFDFSILFTIYLFFLTISFSIAVLSCHLSRFNKTKTKKYEKWYEKSNFLLKIKVYVWIK